MSDVSIILRNHVLMSIEEFRILDRYTSAENICTLIQRNKIPSPYIIRCKAVEYVLDEETFTFFHVVSNNILVYWNTELTRHLGPGEEFGITDTIFIRHYYS